jgi:hypothetical protein
VRTCANSPRRAISRDFRSSCGPVADPSRLPHRRRPTIQAAGPASWSSRRLKSSQQPVHHERIRRCLGTRVLAFDLHRRLATSPGVSPGLGWSWRLGEDRPHSFGPAPRRHRTHGAADRRLCVGRGSRARMSSASVVHPWRPLDQIGGRRQGRLRRIRLRGLGSRSTRGTGSGAILLVLHGRTG